MDFSTSQKLCEDSIGESKTLKMVNFRNSYKLSILTWMTFFSLFFHDWNFKSKAWAGIKMPILQFITKMISRKIQVMAEKSINFHTVNTNL